MKTVIRKSFLTSFFAKDIWIGLFLQRSALGLYITFRETFLGWQSHLICGACSFTQFYTLLGIGIYKQWISSKSMMLVELMKKCGVSEVLQKRSERRNDSERATSKLCVEGRSQTIIVGYQQFNKENISRCVYSAACVPTTCIKISLVCK